MSSAGDQFHPWSEPASSHRSLRIGIFTDLYQPVVSGVAVSLQLLARALRKAGHDVTIFAPRVPSYYDSEPMVQRIPSVPFVRWRDVHFALPFAPGALRTLLHSRFDVIHVHSLLAVGISGYLAARARRLPLIYTYHTSISEYARYIKVAGSAHLAQRAAIWFSTIAANLSDCVVVPSVAFKRLLREQGVSRPIRTIPNGIDLGAFSGDKTGGGYRARLGLGKHVPLLLYVGRLDAEKGVDFLIDAFSRVVSQRPDAHLVLAGGGSSKSRLVAQARASGYCSQIHFVGVIAREDVPILMSEADLFVTASTSEVQPLSMIEALAAGLPVVAVGDKAYEGMVLDGVNGRYATREARAFGAVIIDALSDFAVLEQYSRRSIELSRGFSVESQAASLIALYREAIRTI